MNTDNMDDYTDDGKTMAEEARDSMQMLTYVLALMVLVAGGVLYYWVLA